MTRPLATLAAAAVLALPLLALAAMVADAEWDLHGGTVIRVRIIGYDPRDIVRGHFLRYRIAWNWQDGNPDTESAALCILAAGENPPVRPLPPEGDPACRLVLDRDPERPGRFMPAGVSDELFVPEDRAQTLQSELLAGTAKITLDLVVRPDRSARIKAWQAGTP